jgi:hypothetical protein
MVQFSPNDDSAESVAEPRPPKRAIATSEKFCVFTPETANRILPLVSRIAHDLIAVSRDLEIEAAQIRGIGSLGNLSDIRSFSEELDCVKEAFRAQSELLSGFQKELSDLGIAVDSLREGAFDFPAYFNSRPIRLCWKLGEPEVTHWHGINESFCDRRRLDASATLETR